MRDDLLQLGTDGYGSVTMNHFHLPVNRSGVGHITWNPEQARTFGNLLLAKADQAEREGAAIKAHNQRCAARA